MLKRMALLLAFLVNSCVTVNIYFPAAAVERAADEIVKETWGGRTESAPKESPRSLLPTAAERIAAISFTDEAFAQEADINVSNPAIRALKDSIKNRSGSIKPFMDRGNVGIRNDGLLTVRTTDGLTLKERAEVQQLVDAENRDREALYLEIAKANNFPQGSVAKIKSIFARSWVEQAQSGWWIQDGQGNWKKK